MYASSFVCLDRKFPEGGRFPVQVMNEKLNHCVELADMLTTNLADQHHVRLEWMIIALIMVEVGFEVIHFLERYT